MYFLKIGNEIPQFDKRLISTRTFYFFLDIQIAMLSFSHLMKNILQQQLNKQADKCQLLMDSYISRIKRYPADPRILGAVEKDLNSYSNFFFHGKGLEFLFSS